MIYVLRCEGGKYYIGYTKKPKKRVAAHFGATGSEWTKRYKPIEVLESIAKHDMFDEDKLTKKYMMQYGVENVRGGTYVRLELPQYQKFALRDELRMASGVCMRCGVAGHFVALCPHDVGLPTDTAIQTVHADHIENQGFKGSASGLWLTGATKVEQEAQRPLIDVATQTDNVYYGWFYLIMIAAAVVVIAIYLLFCMYS